MLPLSSKAFGTIYQELQIRSKLHVDDPLPTFATNFLLRFARLGYGEPWLANLGW